MRLFHVRYDGYSQPVFASDYIAARRLGIRHLVNQIHIVDLDKVAVVDAEMAGGYQHGRPLFRASPNFDRFAFAEVASGGYGFE